MNETTHHAMSLEEYAALAQLRPFPPHPGGVPIIITPALADALNLLIGAAAEVASGAASRSALRIALASLKALHDYETRCLGGAHR